MNDRARRDQPLGLAAANVAHEVAGSRAADYDDIYCSRSGGLAESQHVFIEGNDLEARFARLLPSSVFVIGETGFGAGRNMLLAWQRFKQYAAADAHLRLISIEAHPLDAADLARMTARWGALADEAARLQALWPAPIAGVHRLWLDSRTSLDLYFGDVATALDDISGQVDAWFLDGFSPAKNPAMWTAQVCGGLARRSRYGATLATYSAARALRDHLTDAGFSVWRRSGHGQKKHCLAARYNGVPASAADVPMPWYSRLEPLARNRRIAVIGAGIAGASAADALARRGFDVVVYDAMGVASGASGNRDAALNPRLAAEASPRTRLDLAALGYAARWLVDLETDIDKPGTLWRPTGVLQLARSTAEASRQARLVERLGLPVSVLIHCDPVDAEARAGQTLAPDVESALFFPGAGSIDPPALCQALLTRHGIDVVADEITALQRDDDRMCWTLIGQDGQRYQADHVVLACGQAAAGLSADIAPLQAVAGQASVFRLADTKALVPSCVVCDTGYVIPARHGRISVGATYDPSAKALVARAADDEANRARLRACLPALAEQIIPASVQGRMRYRSVSHDRMPLVGGVPDIERWRCDYQALARDARQSIPLSGALWPGLSVSLAHGSNGMLRAPLAAEVLASQLADEPLPIAADLLAALHPGRWWIREIIHGRLAPNAGTA